MQSTVTGAFPDPERVTAAVEALLDEHFESDDIRVVRRESGGEERPVPIRHSMEMGRGAVIGGAAGIVAGAVVSALFAAGVIPSADVGLVADSIPLAATQGAVAGAMLGSLTGLIVGMAIWRTVVDISASDFHAGEVLVGARARGRGVDRARRVLEGAGATRIDVE